FDVVFSSDDRLDSASLSALRSSLSTWCSPRMTGLDSASLVKRLKTFNIILEQMRQRHMAWTITNRELRAHVKAKTLSGLLDKYREFIIRHGNILRNQRSLDVRVLACEEVETMLADSFSSGPVGKHK
ncbi:unnamed protein product, partial [Closterium sp. NIES-65]